MKLQPKVKQNKICVFVVEYRTTAVAATKKEVIRDNGREK
jgi:hypothetical protein